jgi:hypothetical protein
MSQVHFRRCWDCGAINRHSDNIAPEVCCKRCKSQDTRKMKNEPPLWIGIGSIREGRGLCVPDEVAKCPECNRGLIAECHDHDTETGRPAATGIELTCLSEKVDREDASHHSFRQDEWQPVRDAVAKWCDARVDFPGR